MKQIFVQIACYRDHQLRPTIRSILKSAAHPSRVAVGVCWQGKNEDLHELPLSKLGKVRFMLRHSDESKGIGWARTEAMELYEGEDYVLQLDSHHRMSWGWDTILESQLELAGLISQQPLLTTYMPDFEEIDPHGLPHRLAAQKFDKKGLLHLITGERITTSAPVQGAFISAHFIFANAKFWNDVPPDPRLGFIYEETVLGLKAFSHDWDIFYPSITAGRHRWARLGRRLDWDDIDRTDHYKESHAVYCGLLGLTNYHPVTGKFGLGRHRGIDEYEHFAGVNFRERTVTSNARRGMVHLD